MANAEHIQIIQRGPEAIQQWRAENPNENLDLQGAELNPSAIQNLILQEADLRGANLEGARIENVQIEGANFTGANLRRAFIDTMNGDRVKFDGAQMEKCEMKGRFPSASFISTNLIESTLEDVQLNNTDMKNVILISANLKKANFSQSILDGADLTGADFSWAMLNYTKLSDANLDHANFYEAQLSSAEFRNTKNVDKAQNLGTIKAASDIEYFYTLKFSRINTYISWEKLRTFGRLPLFGASYTALIVMPFVFYVIGFYNSKINTLIDFTKSQTNAPDTSRFILEHISPEAYPAFSLGIWLSAFFLAIASTLYNVRCPSKVKEFSCDQWRYQLQHPVLQYMSDAWKNKFSRIISATFYVVGGAIAAVIILIKMYNVLALIEAWPQFEL